MIFNWGELAGAGEGDWGGRWGGWAGVSGGGWVGGYGGFGIGGEERERRGSAGERKKREEIML